MTETGASAGSANEAARRYIEEGMSVLPAAAGEKEARIKGWQNLILGLDSVDEWFPPSEALNIVRVNGTNSNGRGDIDLDRPEALKIVDYLIPDDVRRFGREGQSLGHVEVRFVDDTVPRSAKYALPGDGNDRMMVELRADGSQTLIHGTYPNGDRCVWEGGEVLAAHATTLHSLAADIAVGALLLLNYPGAGARHEFWLGAIGLLLKARHPLERVRRIVEATARSANDPEWRSRMDIIDTTETRRMQGRRVAGKGKLGKVCPGVPEILENWLNIGTITDSGLPYVICNERPLREVSDEATDALVAANDPPELFARSGSLARLASDSEGRPVIQDIDKDRLRYQMTRTAEYLKVGDDIKHIFPPDAVVGDVMAAKAFAFPELLGITQSPTLRPSGTILTRPGYDPETGLIYVPEGDIKIDVPFEPTDKEVDTALNLLYELYKDFPFVDDASLANMLALTMTPIVRPAYEGPTPLAVIDKPAAGTGASLLCEVVCDIATAKPAAMMSPPEGDEETRKQITAVLRLGRPVVVIDNVPQGYELKHASYARVLTATNWEDRILGHSRVATLPNRATWITSGNNIKVAGDLPRRCYWVRLDAKLEFPADRPPETFTYPDLRGWVATSRGRLLSAILTLARHWFASGKPEWSGRPPGSFEGWARMVGGILESAGVEGFLGNTKEMRVRSADGASEWEEFLSGWHDTYGEEDIKVKRLVDDLAKLDFSDLKDALPAELAIPYAEGSLLLSRKFGEAFSRKEDVRHGSEGLRLTRQKKSESSKKSSMWKVSKGDPGGSGGRGGQSSPPPGKSETKQQDDTGECQEDTKAQNFLGLGLEDPPDPPTPRIEGVNSPDKDNIRQFRPFTLVDTQESLKRCVEAIKVSSPLGCDLETKGKRWWVDEIRIVSVTIPDGKRTYVIDMDKLGTRARARVYKALTGKHLILHNANFDVPFLLREGCIPAHTSCTMVLSRLRAAGLDYMKHILEDVVRRYARVEIDKHVDHECWKRPELTEAELLYAANDTRYLPETYFRLRGALNDEGLARVADIEEHFTNVVSHMSSVGIPVNLERWDEVVEEAIQEKEKLVKLLEHYIGDPELPEEFVTHNKVNGIPEERLNKVNWNSSDQKRWALKEVLKLELPTKPAKIGGEWVKKETLDKNHSHKLDHPIGEAIKDYQAIANFPTTFKNAVVARGPEEPSRYYNGFVYPDWNQLQARTGRMSCSNPPMHNMPKRTKLREAIQASEGSSIISIDFSQIEPRVLAAVSRDAGLLQIFRAGNDIYRVIASRVLGVKEEEVTGSQRAIFKTILLLISTQIPKPRTPAV